uniref:3-beta hydroxysteroid dehydrogenase/isomerase domain-containing protein n=1 Tax=Alexandrium monilatum TaxID=311494 RepID=A0A7S4RE51_9DINO
MAATKAAAFSAHVLTPMQERGRADSEAGKFGKAPKNCVVTGGTGFVGQRLVEMLVERGAERVVSFDIVPPADNVWRHPAIEYVVGDLCDPEAVERAVRGADCVWHNGACVGPYHPVELYGRVNVGGTQNVIAACRKHGVRKLVYSTSPSTRFTADAQDVDGLTEEELPKLPQAAYVQDYAKTKAEGELLVRAECDEALLTIAVAPHQVYGPRDNLFLPNMLEVAGLGKLRVFGDGKNRICFTYVDNYCHALILGERALYPGSPALGKFYIATDGETHPEPQGFCEFWKEMEKVIVSLGFTSIMAKVHLPAWFMLTLGWLCDVVGSCLGRKFKLSKFAVRMLIMHRWFRIDAIKRDLGYQPLVGFGEGWTDTVGWFRQYWLPTFSASASGLTGDVARQTQRKIDIQSASALSSDKTD